MTNVIPVILPYPEISVMDNRAKVVTETAGNDRGRTTVLNPETVRRKGIQREDSFDIWLQ